MVACQMIVEEHVMTKYNAPALKAVGYEGIFGASILGLLLTPLYYLKVSYSGVDCADGDDCRAAASYPVEDAIDAMVQVQNSKEIQVSIVIYILSIAFFNFFGISVTKAMSASHRMVLDSLRTVAVLGVSVWLLDTVFHPEQLVGFFLLLLGTGMYNEIIRVPFLFSYADDSQAARESSIESIRQDTFDGGLFDGGLIAGASEPLLANV